MLIIEQMPTDCFMLSSYLSAFALCKATRWASVSSLFPCAPAWPQSYKRRNGKSLGNLCWELLFRLFHKPELITNTVKDKGSLKGFSFAYVPFGIAPKGTKRSRQELTAPRILPASATATLRLFSAVYR